MAVQDTFDGAKTALTLLNAYSGAVAEAIGAEQATALLATACETLGAAQGKLLRAQAGIGEYDARTARLLLMTAIEKGFGIQSEVIEEAPDKVVVKIGRCSVTNRPRRSGWTPRRSRLLAGSARYGSWKLWRNSSTPILVTSS